MSHSPPTSLARRRFLAAAAAAGLSGLAGCSTLDEGQSSPTTGKTGESPTGRTGSGYGSAGYGEGGYGSSA